MRHSGYACRRLNPTIIFPVFAGDMISRSRVLSAAAFLVAVIAVSAGVVARGESQTLAQQKIKHVIVIYQENWSFDGLFREYPGANGAKDATPQLQCPVGAGSYAPLTGNPPALIVAGKHGRAMALRVVGPRRRRAGSSRSGWDADAAL